MSTLLIRGGRIVDPANQRDARGDLLIVDGRIAEGGTTSKTPDEVIDAAGLIVGPGLIDVRVALREYAPDHLVLPGPGNSLGGICGQILVAEKWRGIGGRDDFERVQAGDRPIVVSMRR